MKKTLTEQWREGILPEGCYYILDKNGRVKTERTCYYSHTEEQCFCFTSNKDIEEILTPVPDYGSLYNPNDGRIPVGLFTVLKLIKRDIEQYQKIRPLTDLECGIKSQVVSLLNKWGVK